jgi:hypothetical protein
MTNKSMLIERITQSNDRIIHPHVGMIEHPARSRYFTPYPILSALFSSQLSRRIKVLIGLIKVQNAVVVCARDAQRISYAAKPKSRGWARVFSIFFGVQAMFALGLVAAAYAGPCTEEIEALQMQVDAVLEATADAGPTLPESQSAGLHHEPTPQSIARAEEQAGEGVEGERALAALARARAADRAGDANLCDVALLDVRREIAH